MAPQPLPQVPPEEWLLERLGLSDGLGLQKWPSFENGDNANDKVEGLAKKSHVGGGPIVQPRTETLDINDDSLGLCGPNKKTMRTARYHPVSCWCI